MKALVVHNSDQVKAVFVGTEEQIRSRLKKSKYWKSVISRLVNEDIKDEDLEESWQVRTEDDITIQRIVSNLFHDGDSEDGYTLLDGITYPGAPPGHQPY